MHGFSDASKQALTTAVYLGSVYSDSTITTKLVTAKNQVVLIKKQAIPQLELLGALIFARLGDRILAAIMRTTETV